MLDVKTFSLGELGTNAFLLTVSGLRECLVVDCPENPQPLIRALEQGRNVPQTLVLTHGHFDHLAGTDDLLRAFPEMKIAIHRLEEDFLTDPSQNLSGYWSRPVTGPKAHRLLEEGDEVVLGPLKFQVFHTPGHSPGSLVLYNSQEHILFAGDLVFKDSVGRSDFPHSSPDDLMTSLKEVLLPLPDETRIYCGHGPSTLLGREKKMNPFLRELQ